MVERYFDLSSFYDFLSSFWSFLPAGVQLFVIATFGMFVVFGVFRMVLR